MHHTPRLTKVFHLNWAANTSAFQSYLECLEPTSRVEIALATADWGILVSQSLIWPDQSLCCKKHFVIGLLELPENLLGPSGKDKIIAKREEWKWIIIAFWGDSLNMFILQFKHNRGFKLCEERTVFVSLYLYRHTVFLSHENTCKYSLWSSVTDNGKTN